MGRKKANAETGDLLAQRPTAAPIPSASPKGEELVPTLVEYKRAGTGELWRVEKWEGLSAEFQLSVTDLPVFHEISASSAEKAWLMARRLYGIMPVVLPMGADPAQFRIWSADELGSELGVTPEQVGQELAALRGVWLATRHRRSGTEAKPVAVEDKPKPTETLFPADELLIRHGFVDSMFQLMTRMPEENRAEKEWFGGRVQEWSKMLEHRVAGAVARRALLNELALRRLEVAQMKKDAGTVEWRKDAASIKELEDTLLQQLTELDKIFPWASAATGAHQNKSVLTSLIAGIQEYSSKGENTILDGMCTALEIQMQLRTSVQAPEPQYRASLVVMANAARAGLWDTNWRPSFKPAQLKKLEEGWRAGFKAAGLELGEADERIPDLESDDPENGEYEPLHTPDGA